VKRPAWLRWLTWRRVIDFAITYAVLWYVHAEGGLLPMIVVVLFGGYNYANGMRRGMNRAHEQLRAAFMEAYDELMDQLEQAFEHKFESMRGVDG
jgi:hypothetical protein